MEENIEALFARITTGDRVALGKAMTMMESERRSDRENAIQLLALCEKKLATGDPSIRLAISGAPGVGKSTLIEALGMKAIAEGHKVGVLTVDPSSSLSQGSILGDKSRMNQLSVSQQAFIRSSAAGNVLGGLGRRSMEMMTLLAAVGYDIIFLETVGVGQSEHAAWKMTDGFVLVIQPGAGDELQGIKRGITELADIVIVNKADQQLASLAKIAKAQYDAALHLFSSIREFWIPKVVTCSAAEGHGIDGVWQVLRLYKEHLHQTIAVKEMRQQQKREWLTWSVSLTSQQLLLEHPEVIEKIHSAEKNPDTPADSIFSKEYEIENLMKEIIYHTDVSKK